MAITIEKFCELCGVKQHDLSEELIRLLIDEDCIENEYTLRVWDAGSSETMPVAEDDDFAKLAEDYMEDGDWDGPARIAYSWEVTDLVGDTIDEGSDELVIEPDHDELIRKAGGDTDCDHDWTSEGEGGCSDNPGVWSTGGTSMMFRSHCRSCGLIKIERTTGSQRNPGECDTVSYEQPDTWCSDCESEECSCNDQG